jgi:hypothetical protein
MRVTSAAVSVIFLMTVAGCTRQRTAASHDQINSSDPVGRLTEGFDPAVRRDVERVRRATAEFHDLAAAGEVGYPTTLPGCVSDSTMGGMGHHMIDRTLFDGMLDVERPEMLIYAPSGDGKVELVAVEYVVPYSAVAATEKPPRLFGQALKPYDQFKYWALHVWAWRRNAAGLFADWNPAVKC